MSREEWRPIVGFEKAYEVSSLGNVRSHHRYEVRERKQSLNRYGYKVVNLKLDGHVVCKPVHCAMAEAFLGPRPAGYVVNHKDGVKHHNVLSNLEYVTNAENMAHAVRMNLIAKGEDNAAAKLRERDVRKIRKLYVYGSPEFGTRALARKFGMSQYLIYQIVNNRLWKHLITNQEK